MLLKRRQMMDTIPYKRKDEQYFTIEATEDGTTVYFRQSLYAESFDGIEALKVEVSTDNGNTWTEITAAPAGGVPGAILAELNEGDKVIIRGENEAYGYFSEMWGEPIDNCNFYADSPCYVYGNIMSLIGGDDFARLKEVKEYAFTYFFSDYMEEYDWSWVLSKEGDELLLPATTLSEDCYAKMFNKCTGLTIAPKLPATTLAVACYTYMFSFCTGLTSAPTLPATTLVNSCYYYMFRNCTGLTTASELPATTLAPSCYSGMFFNCTNLSYIKAMFTTTPGTNYTRDWVKNVKGTGIFVKNSAATWNVTGNNGIPTGWTVETADA